MKKDQHEEMSDVAYPWHNEKKTIYPMVVIMDPAMTKAYGSYPFQQLKSGKFRTIFKKAMDAHEEDVDDMKIIDPEEHDAQLAAAEGDPAAVVKKFKDTQFEEWTSKAGSTISAKLVSASMQSATFVDRNGREMELSLDQLDDASAKRVKDKL